VQYSDRRPFTTHPQVSPTLLPGCLHPLALFKPIRDGRLSGIAIELAALRTSASVGMMLDLDRHYLDRHDLSPSVVAIHCWSRIGVLSRLESWAGCAYARGAVTWRALVGLRGEIRRARNEYEERSWDAADDLLGRFTADECAALIGEALCSAGEQP
jgi:hypothetical protein